MKAVHIILCILLWFAVRPRSARMRLVKCKKFVVANPVRCSECPRSFHLGCAKYYILQKSVNSCCLTRLACGTENGCSLSQSLMENTPMDESEARMAPAWEEVLAQVNATSSQLQSFIKHQQNINAKLDRLPKIMQALFEHSDRLTALEQAHASIMSRQSDSNVSGVLRDDSASLSKSSHNMLTVSGIPQMISDTPEEVIKKVFPALGVPEMNVHVLSVRRLTKSDNTGADSLQRTNVDTQPVRLSYVVTLASGVVRDHIIDKKRVKRLLTVKEVLDVNSNIYVNEFLHSRIYNLLRQAKARAKQAHYGSVWVWKGRVCVRKAKRAPIIYIDTEGDLAKTDLTDCASRCCHCFEESWLACDLIINDEFKNSTVQRQLSPRTHRCI